MVFPDDGISMNKSLTGHGQQFQDGILIGKGAGILTNKSIDCLLFK
jgi:hypothetical protein